MLSASTAFHRLYAENPADLMVKATLTLANGTVLNLTGEDFMEGGFSFSSASSTESSFVIGAATVGGFDCTLNNIDGKFDEYDFTGAEIVPYVGIQVGTNSIEWLAKGRYWVEQPDSYGNTIGLYCVDNMTLLEKPYSDVSTQYPASLQTIVNNICTACGVVFATPNFPNKSYSVVTRPDDGQLTCLQMVSHVAQIACSWACADANGQLAFRWYDVDWTQDEAWLDGGTYLTATTPYSDGDAADGGSFHSSGANADGGSFGQPSYAVLNDIYSLTISTDDVLVTGVEVTASGDGEGEGESSLYGASGYVLKVDGNPLVVRGQASTVAPMLGDVVGMRFRPFQASADVDPCYEAGDPVIFPDAKGNYYRSYITSLGWSVTGSSQAACNAETPARNSAATYSAATAAIVANRKAIRHEITAREAALLALSQQLAGASGFYTTADEQSDGSVIYYMHDQPTLAQSTTIWKATANSFGVSNDGGQTYSYGVTSNGVAILNQIYTIGLDADYVTTGRIADRQANNYWDLDTGDFRMAATGYIGGREVSDVLSAVDSTITGVQVQYAQDQSPTTAPTSGWSTTSPSWQEGYYIWQRTATTTQTGTSYSTPVMISGKDGADGTSVTILGSYDTLAELQAAHPTGSLGDGYIVAGDLYVWNGSAWENVGTIQGPQGEPGAPGAAAIAYSISASVEAIVRSASGTISPASVTFSATSKTGSNDPVSYSGRIRVQTSNDGSTWTNRYTSSSDQSSYTYTPTSAIASAAKYVRGILFAAGGTTTQLDAQTVAIVTDGTNGAPGAAGADAYSVVLSNESHTFAGNTSSAVADSTECSIIAYKGASRIAATIGTITGKPTGMTTSISNNGTTSAKFTVSVSTSMTTRNGTLTVPLTIDGKSFTATFSYALALIGATGGTGTGVSAVVPQYYLSTSSTTQTGGSWSTAQPEWASGKYIWTRSEVTWTDGSTTTTTPVLAKAINGANQTASNASAAVTALDNSLDQTGVFNRLTNNGALQGLYMNNGQLYVNASYIQSGVLKLGGLNNADGTMVVYDASGNEISKFDNSGAYVKGDFKLLRVNTNEYQSGRVYGGYNMATYLGKVPNIPVQKSNMIHGAWQSDPMVSLHGLEIDIDNGFSPSASAYGIAKTIIAPNNSADRGSCVGSNGPLILLSYFDTTSYKSSWVRIDNTYVHMDVNSSDYTGSPKFSLNSSGLTVRTAFTATGTKSRLVETDDYSDRLLYAYETPTPMFGDLGSGEIGEDGLCYVEIDDIFSETARTDIAYQVFLQKCGQGGLWVEEKAPTHFVVAGTPGLKFDWELKAKQADYEHLRLEDRSLSEEIEPEYDFGINAELAYADELRYIEEQERSLYEAA